jgi:hypothetical protein
MFHFRCNISPAKQGLVAAPWLVLLWLVLLTFFFALRFDASERTYFQIDDQVVVWLVDDAVNNGNWQPDWYRAAANIKRDAYFVSEAQRNDIPHDHHYNFSAHILLSAAIIKPLRAIGITAPTIALLHHIAVFWDSVSLLFLIGSALYLGGQKLALASAILYSVFPLAVQGSHYARPDAFLTAMGSATLWLALQKSRINHWHWLLANGLVLGLAIGGKASQLMLGIFPALASCSALIERAARNKRNLMRTGMDGITLLTLIATVLAVMFTVGDMTARDFFISVQSVQLYYQHPGPPDLLEHYSFGIQLSNILHYFFATLGWPFLLMMIAGIVHLSRQPDKLPLLLLTIPLLVFTLYFASVPAFFDRSFCSLAAAIVLLAAVGINRLIPASSLEIFSIIIVSILACWKPAIIQYHLQTDHLREYHGRDKLAFQQQLKKEWSAKTGKKYWLKNIDRSDMFSQSLPEIPARNPRIFVAEDLNDWNSRTYLQKLRDNGFVQIAEFRGDFADMPTNSLITVHEAARFVYFIQSVQP